MMRVFQVQHVPAHGLLVEFRRIAPDARRQFPDIVLIRFLGAGAALAAPPFWVDCVRTSPPRLPQTERSPTLPPTPCAPLVPPLPLPAAAQRLGSTIS